MATMTATLSDWLAEADVPEHRLSALQQGILQAAHRFRQAQGSDYYSTRLLGHFLLHAGSGLKVAQVARLLGISRPTASRQQGLSSKQVIQQAHHRMDGKPYGKLLPRYAGPIAGFLLRHPEATRYDLIDFIGRTFGVRVSRVAVYKFLKKYGLDHVSDPAPPAAPACPAADPAPLPALPAAVPLPAPVPASLALPAGAPAPPFSSAGRSTRAPSC